MYRSKFASDMENMLITLHNSGLQAKFINYFLTDFDDYCLKTFPDATLLTTEIAEKWIHNSTSSSKKHLSRRVYTMKYLGRYQNAIGKEAYVPNYTIKCPKAEEPHLFSYKRLIEFFEKVDSEIIATKKFPYDDVVFPVMFRLIYPKFPKINPYKS